MCKAKDVARKILDQLPDNSTWNDILHAFYVQMKVTRGLAELDAGRMVSQEDVEQKWLR
jgi:hypothetical protein